MLFFSSIDHDLDDKFHFVFNCDRNKNVKTNITADLLTSWTEHFLYEKKQ